ncbi:hypothetical protein [Rhodococcus gannanensis]|uniref:Uncharacterized protein n=1 Tax=Rhodococcus gannanensis TaxID=1960308 RepID=A0ABW4NZI8_9NOCA
MPTIVPADSVDRGRPGFGDEFPALLLVNPDPAGERRVLGALHRLGIAAADGDRDHPGQKLFGTRIVADTAADWAGLQRWVRAVVAFGPEAWASTRTALALPHDDFRHGATVVTDGDRPITVVACTSLGDPGLTDDALRESLVAGQSAARLTWGCGGK